MAFFDALVSSIHPIEESLWRSSRTALGSARRVGTSVPVRSAVLLSKQRLDVDSEAQEELCVSFGIDAFWQHEAGPLKC
ncbi:MAG: hypothetical protein ACR2I4_01230 [Actinomycetota bacterium]